MGLCPLTCPCHTHLPLSQCEGPFSLSPPTLPGYVHSKRASCFSHNSMTTFLREDSLLSPSLEYNPLGAQCFVFLIVYLSPLSGKLLEGRASEQLNNKQQGGTSPWHFCILHPIPLFTVKSNLGGSFLNGQGCFLPFALVQFPDCLCKSHLCQRRNPCSPDPHHTTGGDISGRLQQSEQVSFSILQGPWASTSFSLHPSGHLDRHPPLSPAPSHAHDTPLPSPQQSPKGPARYPGRQGPWSLALEDPHPICCNKSAHSRWLAADLPPSLY